MQKLYTLFLFIFLSPLLSAQTMMPLPPHNTVYTGSARGYWFVAPTSFTITGLRVPSDAGSGLQYIHVMECHDPFPVSSGSQSSNFTTLTYISGAANGVIQNVNIPVNAGDTIGILGTAGQGNSYSASAVHYSTIGAFPVVLSRLGYQGDIDTGPAPAYWGVDTGTAGQISRVEMYYVTGPCTDPPTAGTVMASDTSVCPGAQVQLDLLGYTNGTGQIYQWDTASSASGPFVSMVSGALTPVYTIYPASSLYYRAKVTCGSGTDSTAPVLISMHQSIGGTATASVTTSCAGAPVQLDLTGNSDAPGQTYTWESATNSAGPYTPVSSALTTPAYTVNPAVNTYYRAAVTCGSAITYSTDVQITMGTGTSGTFTIDATAPSGNGNFTSFGSAMSMLDCGVNGPVVFNVAPNSGPYTEQVIIPSVTGTSETNTITINGNGNILQATPASSAKYILRLDGADHVKINNLTIESQSPTYGWGIHFMNGASNNKISNVTINLNGITSTSSTNSAGFVASASGTSSVTDGDNGNHDTVMACTVNGGYRCLSWYGSATTLSTGNFFYANTLQDYYADGIIMEYTDSTQILENDINRLTRTNETTGAGMEIGTDNRNLLIYGNRIHDTHTNATSGTYYGIYFTACDAPIGQENKVINNLFYKFNSSSGTIYALYNSNSNGVYYFHNTIVLDHNAATSGTTRGFYQTGTASDIQLKNNNFYITRSGTGTKYVLYFATSASSIISDNNNLYINAPSGSNSVGYSGGAKATLANWKTANGSAYDQQSVSIDPQFQTTLPDDYTPTSTAFDDLGTPLSISRDILGNSRSSVTPDLGAYEFLNITSPLSVQLLSFTAVAANEDVKLSWLVGDEKAVSHYTAERSLDGHNFEKAGTVKAENKAEYALTDRNALKNTKTGKLYYRLKIENHNGSVQHSAVAIVNLGSAHSGIVSVYPNPFDEQLIITAKAEHEGVCSIDLIDLTGKNILHESRAINAGISRIGLTNLSNIPKGIYQLRIEIEGTVFNTRIMK